MKFKVYAIFSVLVLTLSSSLLFTPNANASYNDDVEVESKEKFLKLTTSCHSMPFGGEEVGMYDIEIRRGFGVKSY